MADLYAVLGVARTADAAALKRAYRKLAKELHPDKNKDNPAAADRFKRVTAAYDILSDAEKRGQYDRGEIDSDGNPKMPEGFGGFRHGPGGGGFRPSGADFEFQGDPSDLFSELFGRAGGGRGGFRAPPPRGADMQYRLAVPLADAALARSQRVTLRNGKSVEVKLPRGVEDGQKIRLAGQGEAGPGGAGDAIVQIVIAPDARFTREGDDVRTDLMVPLQTAVLGGKARLTTLDGAVDANIAAGTTSGRVLRLRGKGWMRRDGSRGDLLARVLVDVPADDKALADFLRGRVMAE